MTELQEFIEAYSDLLKSDDVIVHCDNDGNIYSTIEAAYAAKKSGKSIELINLKETAMEELNDMGITKSEASQMVQLLEFLYSGKRGRKSKR
ncbi:hypothetical protein [Cyclobacterium jeungdonense]|uniref:Uncharacterized protein n=1 Tax=Cyclobacterium jeungdonense TaxID=708087 RepID=A0ABT8CBC7_9BACT|nr:hypothetical protein [Cyclobacterium jeungdonense]MDN3690113.1 hypothetical protein [Cyclobacterium jeungdonense]